jgi:hypothetical protein
MMAANPNPNPQYKILNVRTWLGASLVFLVLNIVVIFAFLAAVQYGLSTGYEGTPAFNWDEYWGSIGGFFGGLGAFLGLIITIVVLAGISIGGFFASSRGLHWLVAIIVPVAFLLGGIALGVVFYVWGIDWLGMLFGLIALVIVVGIAMLLSLATLVVAGAFNRIRRRNHFARAT